jgi:hypothetical protein
MAISKINNVNETITHLALPERQIPVLIRDGSGNPEGSVPAMDAGKPPIGVRRLLPSIVHVLATPQGRGEIEKQHGHISEAEWHELLELLSLIGRVNSGKTSPVTLSNGDAMRGLPTLLDRLSPSGWVPFKDKSGKLKFRPARGRGPLLELDGPIPHGQTTQDRKEKGVIRTVVVTRKTLPFALSEAFTRGMRKTRFVVWWSNVARRLAPGLYCPDFVTALYALAMWSIGTAGGWAVCQRCKKNYLRSRAQQVYCSHKCQAAAGMQRYRKRGRARRK